MSSKQNEGFLDHLQFEKHDCPGPTRSVLGYGCYPRRDPQPNRSAAAESRGSALPPHQPRGIFIYNGILLIC